MCLLTSTATRLSNPGTSLCVLAGRTTPARSSFASEYHQTTSTYVCVCVYGQLCSTQALCVLLLEHNTHARTHARTSRQHHKRVFAQQPRRSRLHNRPNQTAATARAPKSLAHATHAAVHDEYPGTSDCWYKVSKHAESVFDKAALAGVGVYAVVCGYARG